MNADEHGFDWPDKWQSLDRQKPRVALKELQREMPPGHKLFTSKCRCLGRRVDRDDFLFEIVNTTNVAQVHLTYSKETNPTWPWTEIYDSLDEWRHAILEDDR